MLPVTIIISDIRRGYAKKTAKGYKIVIPSWAMRHSPSYWVYYVCHECAHVTCRQLFHTFSHTAEYKAIEDMYLADFGITIKRKKTYPKHLYAFGQKEF